MQRNENEFSRPICKDKFDHVAPYEKFLFALESKESKGLYPKLLKMFFDFMNIESSHSVEERAYVLFEKSEENGRGIIKTKSFDFL